MNQCVSMQRSWHGWEAKEKTNVYPTPNQKHPLLLLFFCWMIFFHFQVCFERVFDKLDGRCIGRGVDTFKCATCGGTHLPELWRNTSSNSHFKAGNKVYPALQQDHTIPYHTIPYPFSHSVHHGSLVCCRQDQRGYIGNLETFDNFLTNLHSRGFRGVACHQQLAF